MIRKIITFSAVIIISLLSTGCFDRSEKIAATTWSENSEEVVFLEGREKKPTGTTHPSDDDYTYRLRLGTISKNGDNKRYLTKYFGDNNLFHSYKEKSYKINKLYYRPNFNYFIVNIATYRRPYFMYRLDGTFFKRFTTPSHRCNTIHNDYYANLTPSPSGELIILINWEGDCSFKATIYNMNLEVDIFNPIEIPGYKINGVFWVNETSVMINTCLEYSKCVDNWMLVRDGEVTPIDNELFSSLCLAGSIVDSNINSIGEKVEWREIGSLPTITQVASYVGTEIASVTPENTRAPDSPDGCINVEDI